MASTNESTAQAQLLYVAYYGRPADPAGLEFWADRLAASGSVDDAVAQFGASPEYLAISASLGDDNAALVNRLYQNMFNREAEQAGLDFYVGQLTAGTATLASIALDIANGASGDDATILNNKVQVANVYTQAVTSGNRQYNEDDIPAARNVLAAVGLEASTVMAGETAAQNAVNLLPEIIPGGEFTLDEDEATADYSAATSAVTLTLNGDNDEADFRITGSAFNDRFTLEEFQSAVINGHGGSDTIDFSDLDGPLRISLLAGTFSVEHDSQAFGGSVSNVENVIGTEEADTITGNGADNAFWGGLGDDMLRGGLGDDTFHYEDHLELGGGTVNGQFGDDTLRFTSDNVDLSGVDTSKIINIENLVMANTDNRSTATLTIDPMGQFLGANVITGSAATDTVQLSAEGNLDLTQIEDLAFRSIEVIRMGRDDSLMEDELIIGSTASVMGIQLVGDGMEDLLVLDGAGAYNLAETNFRGFAEVRVKTPASDGKDVNVMVSQANLDAIGPGEGTDGGIRGLGTMGVLSFAGDVDLTGFSTSQNNEDGWVDAIRNFHFGRATQVLVGSLYGEEVSFTGGEGGTDTLVISTGTNSEVAFQGLTLKGIERIVLDSSLGRDTDGMSFQIGEGFEGVERVRGIPIRQVVLYDTEFGSGDPKQVDLRGIDFGLTEEGLLRSNPNNTAIFAILDQETLNTFARLGDGGSINVIAAGALDFSAEDAPAVLGEESKILVEAMGGDINDVVTGVSRATNGVFLGARNTAGGGQTPVYVYTDTSGVATSGATYNLGGGDNTFLGSGITVDLTAREMAGGEEVEETDGDNTIAALIGVPGQANGRLTTGDGADTMIGYLIGRGQMGKGNDSFTGHANAAGVLVANGLETGEFVGLDLGDGDDIFVERGLAWALGAQGSENRNDGLTGDAAAAADLIARKTLAPSKVHGGKGNDSLTAMIDGTELTGGEGNDTFTISARAFSVSNRQFDASDNDGSPGNMTPDGKLDAGGVKIMDLDTRPGGDVVRLDLEAGGEFNTGTGLTMNNRATMGNLKIATPLADAQTDDGGLRVMTRDGQVFTRAIGQAIGTTDRIQAASEIGGADAAAIASHLDSIMAPQEGTYVVFATQSFFGSNDLIGSEDFGDAKLCAFVIKDGKAVIGGTGDNKDDLAVYTIAVFADIASTNQGLGVFAGDIIIV